MFHLALRQTEGLIGSIIHLLGLTLAVPDHTTLSRRAETLEVPRPRPRRNGKPMHLLVDSTGLQLCGAAEVGQGSAGRARLGQRTHGFVECGDLLAQLPPRHQHGADNRRQVVAVGQQLLDAPTAGPQRPDRSIMDGLCPRRDYPMSTDGDPPPGIDWLTMIDVAVAAEDAALITRAKLPTGS